MTQLKFVFLFVVALVPFCIGGCGSSQPTVVPVDPNAEVMSEEEYDQESMGGAAAANDQSQN